MICTGSACRPVVGGSGRGLGEGLVRGLGSRLRAWAAWVVVAGVASCSWGRGGRSRPGQGLALGGSGRLCLGFCRSLDRIAVLETVVSLMLALQMFFLRVLSNS